MSLETTTSAPAPAATDTSAPSARSATYPSMVGKTVLVTGSTDGLGFQTAQELARLGARVLVHGRNPEKVCETVRLVREAGREQGADYDQVVGLVADLSSLDEVRRLAEQVRVVAPRLDVLINNAGVYMDRRILSEDGYEMTFAVNHLAPFLLTNLLLDCLEAAGRSRVVTIASVAHEAALLDFDNLQGERFFDGYEAYALSKLANVLFTYELAERTRGTGVTAMCLHPGVIATKLLTAGFPGARGSRVERGSRGPIHLACSPELTDATGSYFSGCRNASSAPVTYDEALRRRFWEASADLVGLEDGPQVPEEAAVLARTRASRRSVLCAA
jgi:NAD(P)-dependent dehydrogenase (short-subunit alcohol dehydrogenase family)